jgi:hypothetical protein
MKIRLITCLSVLLLSLYAEATNYTVNAGGDGDYTTIQACANAMSAGDTCTVYAGTYNETPILSAGTAGNYKTFNVNGSDVVYVLGFTAASYTKIVGFHIQSPSSPGTGCISIPNGSTQLYITNNVMTECGASGTAMISSNYPNSSSYVFVQGNSLSYACAQSGVQVSTTGTFSANTNSMTVASVGGAQGGGSNGGWVVYGSGLNVSNGIRISSISGTGPYTLTLTAVTGGNATNANETNTPITLTPPVCNSISIYGNHWLVENNDFSHYTLSVIFISSNTIVRNNTFHDQYQYEGAGNSHTDTFFAEPGVSVPIKDNVYEGNIQRNAFGPDAKGQLSQGETCGGTCSVLIERFNVASRIGGGDITNDTTWDAVKSYNNDWVDTLSESSFACGNATTNNSTPALTSYTTTRSAFLNDLYYYTESGATTGCFNAYQLSTTNGSSGVWGYNLAYCAGGCGTVYGHLYQTGTFASEPGQQIDNPNFANYVSAGNSANDYHLQAGSPALNAGTSLTTVAAGDSGSGTSLVVNDASYFQDGYGLSNANSTVNPDCVSVTTVGNHVCITAVNYSTNTLTLASGITRSVGDSVWLYSKSDGVQVLTGSAPDIGAFSTGLAPPTGLTCIVN